MRRRQSFEKQTQKGIFEQFLENFDQKNVFFFGARSPLKLVYIGAKGVFRKILGSVTKNESQNSTKGGPFGSARGRIPEEGVFAPPKPNLLLYD